MADKSLKSKAVKIQGKLYVQVADRVAFFNENFPNGFIKTELLSKPEDKTIVMRAIVCPDVKNPEREFISHAQEVIGDGYINKSSALENCDTSAVGRALGMLGIGIIEGIASADEIVKAQNRTTGLTTGTAQLDQFSPRNCPSCKKEHNGRYAKCLDCWKEGKDASPTTKNPSGGIVGASGAAMEEVPPGTTIENYQSPF